MRHDDLCTITRTTTVKDPVTHIATEQPATYGPYNCRVGKVGRGSGNLTQGQPQGVYTQQLKLYIPNVLANIKQGDIATVGSVKYTVVGVYMPNRHHIEADIIHKEEV